MRLKTQSPSRTRVQSGDLFRLQLDTGAFLFGRVACAQVPMWDYTATLIYIYDSLDSKPTPVESNLVPERLLLPPLLTNRTGWTRGYFVTIRHEELQVGDLLERHCFQDTLARPARFYDENARTSLIRSEPCGVWSIASVESIDAQVEAALIARELLG